MIYNVKNILVQFPKDHIWVLGKDSKYVCELKFLNYYNLSVMAMQQYTKLIIILLFSFKKCSEAVFLVVFDPSMNELWATQTGA